MSSPYGPILTGIGMLEAGKLTKAGRAGYVAQVCKLLATGNADGTAGGLFAGLLPFPPAPGPIIPNATTLKMEPLFWFDPDPLAAMMVTTLNNPEQSPTWNMIFPDLLLAKTATALDANGSTPLFPLFDVSVAFPDLDGFPVALPDLAVKANIMPPPKLLIKLADLGIELKPPSLPIPPIPPSLPDFSFGLAPPSLAIDAALALPQLLLGLIKLPFDLLAQLVLPPDIGLVLKLISLDFGAVIKIAFDLLLPLLAPLIPIVPKILIASLLVYMQDIVAMVIVDILGMIVGAGGVITKTAGIATGLILPS